ncbi:septal ring lytic transglycosylase RlpA family protein [Alphaproteobacteria bacterium]|nr:septal ring lytic transglycosylase RlpA family protein [Alphaproteobacteria bacterium]
MKIKNYKNFILEKVIKNLAFCLIFIVFSGCASTELAVTAIKEISKNKDQESLKKVNNIPIGPGGVYKVGKPYIINNVRYVPKVEPHYNKTGIASWYGKKFHGKKTANGEIYDMNELTAAHKTLPMPSYVQVINIDNGRSIVVRINDRGPFVNNRIIDMSRRGAQLLGFKDKGLAKVRVKIISSSKEGFIAKKPSSDDYKKDIVQAAPITSVEAKPIKINSKNNSNQITTRKKIHPRISLEPVQSNKLFIQIGSFKIYQNALKLGAKLSPNGNVKISSLILNKEEFFRVRLGPLNNVALADSKLDEMIKLGYVDARIIID